MIGAKIYATVGNQEKVDYLVNTYDIPREHVFGSRDSGFLAGLMRETDGRGVDVALNSLSGDLLHSTVSNAYSPHLRSDCLLTPTLVEMCCRIWQHGRDRKA